MHHIWLQEWDWDDMEKHNESRGSCTAMHRSEDGWEHKLWTDDNATDFVRTHYDSVMANNYTNYRQKIQRSNVLRYLVLHHYGGIYLDMDLTCLAPVDELLHVPFLTTSTSIWPVGVNNAFMLARPEHPFLNRLVKKRMVEHAREWPFPWFESMITTGFMFLSNGWMEWVEHRKNLRYMDSVFVLADKNGDYGTHALGGNVTTPLFVHERAGTWHTWDAPIFLAIEKHAMLLCVGLPLMVFVYLCLLLLACCGRPRGIPCVKSHRDRKAARQDAAEARRERADALREHDKRQREAQAQRGAEGLRAPDTAPVHALYDDSIISPIPSYTGGGRTSSIMVPPRATILGGRPGSIYDYAYRV